MVCLIQAELNVPIPSKGLAAFPRHSGVNIIHAHYGHDFLNPALVRDSLVGINHAKASYVQSVRDCLSHIRLVIPAQLPIHLYEPTPGMASCWDWQM